MNAEHEIILPSPRFEGELSLEEVMKQRRSVREYSRENLSTDEVGQLLWAVQGITHPRGYRTAPSAGALYPLEIFLVLPAGVYYYDPNVNRLYLHQRGDYRSELHVVTLEQDSILDASAVFVITAVYERIEAKYGADRGPRYVYIEVGHAAQNLLLQATALDLSGVPVGAFYDEQVKRVLSLPQDHQPLYLIPVGHPK